MSDLGMPSSPAGGLSVSNLLGQAAWKRFSRAPGAPSTAGESRPVDAGGARELEEAAKGFESLLVSRLVESMRASIDEGSLLDGDAGAKQVRDMFWHFLSEEIGASGGLGLWKQLAREYQANDRAVAPSEAGGELEIER